MDMQNAFKYNKITINERCINYIPADALVVLSMNRYHVGSNVSIIPADSLVAQSMSRYHVGSNVSIIPADSQVA